jgi:hypothetical protein
MLSSIVIAVLTMSYGFGEARSGCIETADDGVCRKDIAMMGMEMMGGHGDHGNMGQKDGTGGHEMSGHEQMSHGQMMQWDGMSRHMVPMMKSVNGMSMRMYEIMEKGMTPETMKTMSAVMSDMGTQLGSMSEMLRRGGASEEEMHSLHMKMNATREALGKMQ